MSIQLLLVINVDQVAAVVVHSVAVLADHHSVVVADHSAAVVAEEVKAASLEAVSVAAHHHAVSSVAEREARAANLVAALVVANSLQRVNLVLVKDVLAVNRIIQEF